MKVVIFIIIYKSTNIKNNKVYIGLTTGTLNKRKAEHKSKALIGNTNFHFHNALRKYGYENFQWEIIDKAENIDELKEREIYWISYYDSYENGYNSTIGGEGTVGLVFSEEHRRKLSEAKKGKYIGVNHPMYGKSHSEETINKIRKSKTGENNCRYGTTHSKETLKKMSEVKQGESNPMFGKNHTKEWKEKHSLKVSGDRNPSARAVVQYTLDGEFIAEYSTAKDGGIACGKGDRRGSDIVAVCRGNRKSAFGYKWVYKEDVLGLTS